MVNPNPLETYQERVRSELLELGFFDLRSEVESAQFNQVVNALTQAAEEYAQERETRYRKALERLASPDEMAGAGVTEEMTGPAAVELRTRMAYARAALLHKQGENQ